MDRLAATSHRPSILDLIARADADPGSDEAHFLCQLRAAIAGVEGQPAAYSPRPRSPRPELRLVAPPAQQPAP